MAIILLSFFLIYGVFHYYAYIKLRAVVPFSGWRKLMAWFFILLMTTMPVLTRLLEHAGFEFTAKITAYAGYIWMGFLFFFVSAALLMELLGIAGIVGQWLCRSGVRWPFSPKITFWLPTGVALLACVYGVFEAGNIQTETVTLTTDKLPPGRDRMRIVQISDLHLGLIVRDHKLKQVIAKINQVNPDMLVSTGDLVDGQLARLNGLAKMFQELSPPYGKFAVTGNHEFYVGIQQAQDFTSKAGFQLLRGEYVQIGNWLTVAGLDDKMAVSMGLGDDGNGRLFENVSSETFVLLLKHRPTINPKNTRHVNLQLSGHIHKGQIFPFNLLVHLVYPVPIGLSHPAAGYSLYVSRGTGTWGPPFRLFSPPEITVIDLIRPEKAAQKTIQPK